jgi:tetratricopeptide (TPR) repeat protein
VKIIVLMLTIGLSGAFSVKGRARNDTLVEQVRRTLIRQIDKLYDEGRFKEAIPLAETVVALTKGAKGDEDPDRATSLNNLAELYQATGDYARAEPLLKEALKISQKVFGPEHPETAQYLNNLAALYWAMDDYGKAEALYKEILEIMRKVLGPQHPDTVRSLNNLAGLYKAMGDYAKAESLLEEALEISQKVHGREHLDTVQSLNNLAVLYQDTGDYAKAEPLLKKSLEIRQKVQGREHPETAQSLNGLAVLYQDMADYPKAEPLLKKSLEIRQKVQGREHPDTAESLNNLGELYQDMGDYPKAEPLLKEALEIYQKVLGVEHADTARSLNNLAGLYEARGDYAKAEPLFKEALEIRQKVLGRQHPDTAATLHNLAELYYKMGDYAKAEPLFKEALEIDKKVLGPQRHETADSLNALAALYYKMGDYAKAEPLYKEALEIRQKVLGPQHPSTGVTLNNLAALYQEIGDYAKAELFFKEALEIDQKIHGWEHPDTARGLSNLAELYRVMGGYAIAEALLKESLRIRQKVLGREHPDTTFSLNNLALLYRDMGDYVKAEPLFREALEIRQKVHGREHPDTARSLNNLAGLYEAMGDYVKAEPLRKEALEVRQKVLGPQHPETAGSLNDLAFLELDLGEIPEAQRLGQLGYTARLKVFSQILSFGSEDQRLAYQQLLDPYGLFVALGGSDPILAGAVLHYKGVVLDSIIEDRLLAETGKEEANRDLVEQLNVKKQTLAQLSIQTTVASPQEATERIQALEQEVEDIEGKLARQITELGQARRALTITVEQVQAALPNDTVLVEYVRYRHYLGKSTSELRYGAVVLSADAPPRWVALGSAKEVEATLKSYQALVRNLEDEEEMAAVLREVENEVWKPVEQTFPGHTNRVIVSPDGQLNFLSFATLLDPEMGFVAEKYAIQYVTSGRDLLREPQPTLSKQVIVMANPNFDREIQLATTGPPPEVSGVLHGTEEHDVESLSFAELGGTQRESEQLISKFEQWGWQARSLAGSDVSKRALQNLHGPYILHLATHGFFEPEDSAPKTILNELQFSDSQSDLTKSRFFNNPMHRSGLALSGANRTVAAWKRGEAPYLEEDGILTAEDVSTLDLKGTWLVTLSACDTGSGEAKAGEGVLGLRRGFVEAGAQNLLMTLWPIQDQFTVQIMSDFYDAAHKTGNAPKSLAEVQRDWLVKLRKDHGLARAVNLAGPFIMSSQGKP